MRSFFIKLSTFAFFLLSFTVGANAACKANVCFVIDGSSSISSQSFEQEKNFVTDVVSIISNFNPRVAATQYASKNYPIFAMNTNTNAMTQAVKITKQKRGFPSITAGIKYCGSQLKPFPGQANNVVVFINGVQNTGGSVATAANQIWRSGGVISVVAVGKTSQSFLASLTSNNRGLQFKIDNFNDRFRLVNIIERLTVGFCTRSTPLPSPNVVITKPVSIISQAKKVEIQKKLTTRGGCKANVCFAIDGSLSIRPQSFQNEKDFVTDVVNIINIFNPRVAATQYATGNYPIFPMSTNTDAMTIAVTDTQQKRSSTSITAGINYCFGQIKPFLGQPNKVVVLGDGFHNSGGNVKTAANQIWSNGGVISVVAADDPITKINQALLNSLTGNNPVFQFKISAFTDRFRLVQVIEDLTLAICAP